MVEKYWARGSDRSWGRAGARNQLIRPMQELGFYVSSALSLASTQRKHSQSGGMMFAVKVNLWIVLCKDSKAGCESHCLVLSLCWWQIAFIVWLPARWLIYNVTEREVVKHLSWSASKVILVLIFFLKHPLFSSL